MAEATTLAQALLAFQAEGVKLQKTAINPHFKNRYIGLDALIADVLPVLNKCGLVVLQMPCVADGLPSLTTRIVHAASGEQVEATMPLLLSKTDPQAQGAGLTYARRYALMAFLGLVADEDTDGRTPAPRSAAGTAAPKRVQPEEATVAPAAPANGIRVITEPQKDRLYAIAGKHKVPKVESKRIILEVAGVDSSLKIPMDKYEAVVEAIEKWVAVV